VREEMKRENKTKFSKTYFFNQLEGGLTMKSLAIFLGVIFLIASGVQARERGYLYVFVEWDGPAESIAGIAALYDASSGLPTSENLVCVRELQENGSVCHLGSFPYGIYWVVVEAEGFDTGFTRVDLDEEGEDCFVYLNELEVAGIVSANGGRVETESVVIEVPAGVSQNGMVISVDEIGDDPEDRCTRPQGALACLRVESSIENFAKSVKLTISYPGDTRDVVVVTRETLSDVWTEIGGIVGDNTITVEVTHFSYFAVVPSGLTLQESTWGSVKEMFK
jgi:hypothetical protein